MSSQEELMDIIDHANELIVTQDRLIDYQNNRIKTLEMALGKSEDIIALLKLRIKELEGR